MESNGRPQASEILRQIESLRSSKDEIERQISALEAQLQELNCDDNNCRKAKEDEVNSNDSNSCLSLPFENGSFECGHGLASDMIYRYSRQLLLPSFGVQGQANLLKSSVLVIGAGGLGSPALLYLAACGVGKMFLSLSGLNFGRYFRGFNDGHPCISQFLSRKEGGT